MRLSAWIWDIFRISHMCLESYPTSIFNKECTYKLESRNYAQLNIRNSYGMNTGIDLIPE